MALFPYFNGTVNRRNNEAQAHIAKWALLNSLPSIYGYKRIRKRGSVKMWEKTRHEISVEVADIFSQCRAGRKYIIVYLLHLHVVVERIPGLGGTQRRAHSRGSVTRPASTQHTRLSCHYVTHRRHLDPVCRGCDSDHNEVGRAVVSDSLQPLITESLRGELSARRNEVSRDKAG